MSRPVLAPRLRGDHPAAEKQADDEQQYQHQDDLADVETDPGDLARLRLTLVRRQVLE